MYNADNQHSNGKVYANYMSHRQ